MKTSDDIKYCMTDGVPNEILIRANSKNKVQPGKCKSCRHRDPEDKKCDCGGLERQGCPFPVSDDYYCKYYEKGGAKE